MAKKKRIIKNGYIAVVSDDKLETAEFEDYVYEHRIVAEEILDRPLKEGKVVHHLDENRANNSPDNLLVLSGPMHAKLHTWLDKNTITPTPEYAERIKLGCVRCKVCEKPIDPSMVYCSSEHANQDRSSDKKPPKEELEKLVEEFPFTKLGELFGVSDNAVRKWCKKDGIETAKGRGFWSKK